MEYWLPAPAPAISGDPDSSASLLDESFFLNGRDNVKLPLRCGKTSPTKHNN